MRTTLFTLSLLIGGAIAPAAPAAPAASAAPAAPASGALRFDFGSGPAAPGYTRVTEVDVYSGKKRYGFESPLAGIRATAGESPDAVRGDGCTSDRPFRFSVALPEGNYNVTVTLGDPGAETDTTVKAEQRRLMLQGVRTVLGKFETRTFTVNVHTPAIETDREVGLKPGEKGPPLAANWDEKLTLEFNGSKPSVCALEIVPARDALTVYLAGDSTVTDGRAEPWAAWGQMLPRFFQPGVAVANIAESGLTLSSFRAQRRLEKILTTLKAGDYVLIQFGHNDQKEKGGGPFTTYKANLKEYVAQVRAKGGQPVVLTPMERRRWSGEGKPQATLSDYAEAVRQVGKEEGVPVIDLNALSLRLYEALGPEGSKKAFVFHPANTFPGQKEELKDNTHFGNYGAYELARCVVEGIRAGVSALAARLAADVTPFDPSRPDPVETFGVPASIFAASEKPDGS